jgi:iron complex outermembrane receptor protein
MFSFALSSDVKGKLSFGAEVQSMRSPIDVLENNFGDTGALLLTDKLRASQAVAFLQLEVDLPSELYFTLGASESWLSYKYRRTYPEEVAQKKRFEAFLSPRVALLKKIDRFSIHASVSRGFSPPTLAEVRPSTNVFNGELKPECGINYEIGTRGNLRKFSFDWSAYQFELKETIVLRRGENGEEFFNNAGATRQRGTELMVTWRPSEAFKTWGTFAYTDYRFTGESLVKGNELTGTPEGTATLGVDVTSTIGLYFNATYSYTDQIPLNDANTAYAADYFLLGGRLGFRKTLKGFGLDVFFSVDNAFNEKYSLGNDLNAFGGRYFNTALPRNYSAGLILKISKG